MRGTRRVILSSSGVIMGRASRSDAAAASISAAVIGRIGRFGFGFGFGFGVIPLEVIVHKYTGYQ
jgi:hypothetical protein